MQFSQEYKLSPTGSADVEDAELSTLLSPYTDKQPTGIYIEAGGVVEFDVSQGQFLSYSIGAVDAYINASGETSSGNLSLGKNKIIAETSGILYLHNNSVTTPAQVEVSVDELSDRVISFRLGQDDPLDWQNLLDNNPNAETVELVGERSYLLVSTQTARDNVIDPAETLKAWDQIIEIEDRVAGLSNTASGVNSTFKGRHQGVEVDTGFLFATHGFTGYNSQNSAAAQIMLDHRYLLSQDNGWGVWHELGHQHQQSVWTSGSTVETTVNIYSLAVCNALGHGYSCNGTNEAYAADLVFANEGAQTRFSQLSSPFEKLGLYAQLQWAFGEEIYQQLHHITRTLDEDEKPQNDQQEADYFVITTSQITGYDLTEYFDQWRFDFSNQARNIIQNLDLKDLPIDLANTDPRNLADATLKPRPNLDPIREYNIPEVTANNGLLVSQNDTVTASDLISYNQSIIQSAEIVGQFQLNDFGEQSYYVRVETANGERNIIPVSTTVVSDIYASPTVESIYELMQADMESFALSDEYLSRAKIHAQMLRVLTEIENPDLVNFYSAFSPSEQGGAIIAFQNVSLEVFNRLPSLVFDTDFYNDVLSANGDLNFSFFVNGELRGRVDENIIFGDEGNNIALDSGRFIQIGSITRIGLGGIVINPDDQITIRIRYEADGLYSDSVEEINFKFSEIGSFEPFDRLDSVSTSDILNGAKTTIVNDDQAILVFDRDFYEYILDRGDLNIRIAEGSRDETEENSQQNIPPAELFQGDDFAILSYDISGFEVDSSLQFIVSYQADGDSEPQTATIDIGANADRFITNTVFFDANENGLFDVGEEGEESVIVRLLDDSNNSVITTETDENGNYSFDVSDLSDGQYRLEVVNPVGKQFTIQNVTGFSTVDNDSDFNAIGRSNFFQLSDDALIQNLDAGLINSRIFSDPIDSDPDTASGSIGSTVFYDDNANGIFDGGDVAALNVSVELYDEFGLLERTTTNINGNYFFDDLEAGTYAVRVINPENTGFTTLNVNNDAQDDIDSDVGELDGFTADFFLGDGQVFDNIDAGLLDFNIIDPDTGSGSIGSTIFYDDNANGIFDGGDVAALNVEVEIYDDFGFLDSTITDINGNYFFDDLEAGTYSIRVINPENTGFTTLNINNDAFDDIDSDVGELDGFTADFFLAEGQVLDNIDAGLLDFNIIDPNPHASGGAIGNTVFYDRNANGLQDREDNGIANVNVQLFDEFGFVAGTLTDEDGFYSFNNLDAGRYAIKVLKPENTSFTVRDAQNNFMDDNDSDIFENGFSAGFDLVAGEINSTLDAGLVNSFLNISSDASANIRSVTNNSIDNFDFDDRDFSLVQMEKEIMQNDINNQFLNLEDISGDSGFDLSNIIQDENTIISNTSLDLLNANRPAGNTNLFGNSVGNDSFNNTINNNDANIFENVLTRGIEPNVNESSIQGNSGLIDPSLVEQGQQVLAENNVEDFIEPMFDMDCV